MVSFKMLGRDADSSPTEHRTWIVDGYPDYDGYYYIGSRGGTNPFINVVAYQTSGMFPPLDFNLPDPTSWQAINSSLPTEMNCSHLAVIDGYIYLFGGKLTNKIYRTLEGRPLDWYDTGATLPTNLYGAQLAIIDGYVYLFGGNNGVATDTIYSAPLTNPLSWTNHGSKLKRPLYDSQLAITGADGYVVLMGGQSLGSATDVVMYASVSDPLTWHDHIQKLPNTLFGSSVAMLGDTIYLFGGMAGGIPFSLPSKNACHINISDMFPESITGWQLTTNVLPYAMAYGQYIAIGNSAYLIGTDKERVGSYYFSDGYIYSETGSESYNTKIFKCNLFNPLTSWTKLSAEIRGEFFGANLAVIYDRLFLIGSSSSTVIAASKPIIKYSLDVYNSFYNTVVVPYSWQTRVYYRGTTNKLNLMGILGYPYWKTNYVWYYVPLPPS